ncbi:MAG TPA: protein-L-isoaspartate(D-aspartate) O-methyltransferase [Terriglobales bacterium]|nr:protein-L-isoaspartate(D-aspartate) O-methyltransferase [Terriglobales bacterium]
MHSQSDPFARARQQMVETQLRTRGIRDDRVLAAMAKVPRHMFVAEHFQAQAYEDHPVPIGFGQTISQPFIVALMLEALAVQPGDSVLEVGTGSGYQTALLAELAARVCSIERHVGLAQHAESVLRSLGYRNVVVVVGDGSRGVADYAPYDDIIVSAAAPSIPSSLFEQLAEAGRMVIPIGPAQSQELQLVRKQQGKMVISFLEGCRFVPLIGEQGYRSDD